MPSLESRISGKRISNKTSNGATAKVSGYNLVTELNPDAPDVIARPESGREAEVQFKLVNGAKLNGKHRHAGPSVVTTRAVSGATPPGPWRELMSDNGNRSISLEVKKDRRLIERCLSGDVTAWSEIYHHFHDALVTSIRRYLNRAGRDLNLVEEIAARVWYALIKNDFELLAKFDAGRGCRLTTYLAVVAKNETRVLFRSERRRRTREQLVSRPDISDHAEIDSHRLMADEDFLMTLSHAERVFFSDVLMASPEQRAVAELGYSTENNWQLRHRIRQKLERYMSESDS